MENQLEVFSEQNEIWVDIVGFENRYQISNFGRVKSLPKLVDRSPYGSFWKEETIMKHIFGTTKYPCINLRDVNGKIKNMSIHRLVALHFIPNPENKPQVNHINGDRRDYRIINLEWCTQLENHIHALRTGANSVPNSPKGNLNHLCKVVHKCNSKGRIIKKYPSLNAAANDMDLSISRVSTCIIKGQHCRGFILKYADEPNEFKKTKELTNELKQQFERLKL